MRWMGKPLAGVTLNDAVRHGTRSADVDEAGSTLGDRDRHRRHRGQRQPGEVVRVAGVLKDLRQDDGQFLPALSPRSGLLACAVPGSG